MRPYVHIGLRTSLGHGLYSKAELHDIEVLHASSSEMVTVQHRGWSTLPADHPARHGKVGAEFSRMIGLWWGELMTSLREYVSARD